MRGRLRDRLRGTAQERDAEIFSDSVRESRRPEYAGSHCPAGRCRQFRNDRHALAFERRASGKVAGQRCGERFSASKDGACSGRVPRPLASPVPSRSRYAFRKPRLFCGPSWAYPVRPSPSFRAQAVFLASFCVRHFAVLRGWSCLRPYHHMGSVNSAVRKAFPRHWAA